jgi:hypothetical protein
MYSIHTDSKLFLYMHNSINRTIQDWPGRETRLWSVTLVIIVVCVILKEWKEMERSKWWFGKESSWVDLYARDVKTLSYIAALIADGKQ